MKGNKSSQSRVQRKIDETQIWFQRILDNCHGARALAGKIAIEDLHERNDLYWALVKYAENVEESITQVDKVDKRILRRLVEIPSDVDGSEELSWAQLKGMRIRLAHAFWKIDPQVLWETVTSDFPLLIQLLVRVNVADRPGENGQPADGSLAFRGEDVLALPFSGTIDTPAPGQCLVFLWFDERGVPQALRIAKKGDRTLSLNSSTPISIKGLYKLSKEKA